MKRLITMMLLTLFLLTAAGCGSKAYKVVTTDQTYTSREKPEYDEESKTFIFDNEEGYEMTIKREDLKLIEEVK